MSRWAPAAQSSGTTVTRSDVRMIPGPLLQRERSSKYTDRQECVGQKCVWRRRLELSGRCRTWRQAASKRPNRVWTPIICGHPQMKHIARLGKMRAALTKEVTFQ